MESQLNIARSGGRDKILALFPGALGDFICFLPALELLARERSVDLLARAEYAGLAPAGVRVGSLERREIARLFVAGAGRDGALARFFDPYEAIYSWTGSGDASFRDNLALIAGARAKLFPFRPKHLDAHIADYYVVCAGGKTAGENHPVVHARPAALGWCRSWLGARGLDGGKILVLAPGSGAPEKNWPAEFFRAVAARWRKSGGQCVVLLGPVEDERSETKGDWRGAAVARDLDLAKVAALLSSSRVYLGNDSGVTHLAAAVGVETIALFGPTDPKQWAPRGRRVRVVSQGVECAPCARAAMKTCPHRKCLAALAPEIVADFLPRFSREKVKNDGAERSLTRV